MDSFNDAISQTEIEQVDKLILSPQQRTSLVYKQIKQDASLTNWDIICFCAGYLAENVPAFPPIGSPVKALGQTIMLIHYLHPDQIDPNYNINLDKSNGNKL